MNSYSKGRTYFEPTTLGANHKTHAYQKQQLPFIVFLLPLSRKDLRLIKYAFSQSPITNSFLFQTIHSHTRKSYKP